MEDVVVNVGIITNVVAKRNQNAIVKNVIVKRNRNAIVNMKGINNKKEYVTYSLIL
ncbi:MULTISPECIES: hypothetical protein [unclassified Bacillus (in: firmicutes)]|uniref:hypothetical protein n=1 Tax=unclassified Bacillus (in: firmicutes) TaxID=185979 RepID=UPI00178C372D|nr:MULTISPECIES: hypothetical protein [unclassified Bacillus (in: firmicutes)]